jgi:hypothetical protein
MAINLLIILVCSQATSTAPCPPTRLTHSIGCVSSLPPACGTMQRRAQVTYTRCDVLRTQTVHAWYDVLHAQVTDLLCARQMAEGTPGTRGVARCHTRRGGTRKAREERRDAEGKQYNLSDIYFELVNPLGCKTTSVRQRNKLEGQNDPDSFLSNLHLFDVVQACTTLKREL